jgi:hypothetical protein
LKVHFIRAFLVCIFSVAALVFVWAEVAPPSAPVQKEFDRFVEIISEGMRANGRVSTVTAKPDASDETLIDAAAQQLNAHPAPLKNWHILKKEHMGPEDFEAVLQKKYPDRFFGTRETGRYLIAVIDSDQGQKIIWMGEGQVNGGHWARMYNCDATFTSPQDGGTPLIRTNIPVNH